MLRKMGKPDTLRVLYRKVFVRKVWRLVQLDLLGIGFRTYVWSLQGCRNQKELICGPYIKRSKTGLVPHNAPSVPFKGIRRVAVCDSCSCVLRWVGVG